MTPTLPLATGWREYFLLGGGMTEEPKILLTCIFDDYVQLSDGKRVSHAEYSAMTGQHWEPGPLTVKVDYRKMGVLSDAS